MIAGRAASTVVKAIADAAVAFASRDRGGSEWLDLDVVADVTISVCGQRIARGSGAWSAEWPGEQMIEIRFRRPTTVSRLRVVSTEVEQSRTQEMTIWASLRRGERHREILRQQFNFRPGGATAHVEECVLQLEDVSALHLRVVPSLDGRRAVARVSELHVAA